MYLVIGATGMVGGEICHRLSAAGEPSRALVRATSNPDRVERLKNLGVTIVPGDLRAAASLKTACRGVSAVIATASSIPLAYQAGKNTPQITDQDGYLHLIAAAKEAGVQQFVYTSCPPAATTFPLQDAKHIVEQALRSSGLTYTILRPTYFSEAWLSPEMGFDFPNCKTTLYGTGKNPISWISLLDVARFAVACLGNPAARNVTLELGGPEAISPLEVVRLFEKASGRPFEVSFVPVKALRDQLAGDSDPMQKTLAGLMLNYARCQPIDMTVALRTFPLKLKSIAEYVNRVLGLSLDR